MIRPLYLLLCLSLLNSLLQAQTFLLRPKAPERLGDALIVPEQKLTTKRANNDAAKTPSSFKNTGSIPISGFTIDTSNRNDTAASYHRYFTASEGYETIHGFTGNVPNGIAGTVSNEFQDMTLRRINYYRAQAGLPADIYFTTTKNQKSQEAALIMAYENNLSHYPATAFPTNPYLSADGIEAAGNGNLSLGTFGPRSVDGQMTDDGSNNAAVGHRRWLLYPRAQEMGNGATPANGSYPHILPDHPAIGVVWVIGDFKAISAPQANAWPNAGYIPWELVPNNGETFPRWSYSYPNANFTNANVSMTQGGNAISLVQEAVSSGAGDNTIVWRPTGIPDAAPTSDTTYTVSITGITNAPFSSTSYDVTLVDPYRLNNSANVTGNAAPIVGTQTTYTFNAIDQAEAYEARIGETNLATWSEGAEDSPIPQIMDETQASYSLINSAYSASGSKAFHLTTADFSDQSLIVDRTIIPQSGSHITFKYRRFWMHPDTKLRIELSLDDGASYTTISTIDGQNSSGSSIDWDAAFINANIAVPAPYINHTVKLRLRLEASGSTFTGTEQNYGLHIDDIATTNSLELTNQSVQGLASNATHFTWTPNTVGQQYYLQVRPQLGGHWFGYGDALVTIAAAVPPAPVISSSTTATGEQGAAFAYYILATHTPASFSATNLPPGASLDTATGEITGSIAPGTYSDITISANNDGGTGSATLTIYIQTGYEAAVANAYPGLGAPTEDDDADGVPNIIELAILGMDPTTPDTALSPTAMLTGSSMTLTVNKSGIAGLDYHIEGSETLLPSSWTTDHLTMVTDNSDELTVSYPINSSTKYFLRLTITQNSTTTIP